MKGSDGSVHCCGMGHCAVVHAQPGLVPTVASSEIASETAPSVSLPFDAIYREHFAFVWRNARRLGVDGVAVDDVVQDVFLVVHRKLHEFEGRGSIRSWLYSITVRVTRDHLKSRRRRRIAPPSGEGELEVDAIADASQPSPVDCAETANKARLVRHLLDQLREDRREILVLAEFEEMTAPEMSEALGIPVNTVYSRLRVARQEFDQALARHRARTTRRTT